MIWLPLIILALVQGLTEFLPVSSSGHLVLVHAAMDGTRELAERRTLDVAVHVGTLLSVLVYFRSDVLTMIKGALSWLSGDFTSDKARLPLYILAGSLPVIAAGFVLHKIEPSWLALVEVMAWATIIFGIVLWIADRMGAKTKTLTDMNFKDAVMVGCAQVLALIPGTSRSGITMTAGRFLGYTRTESAHFSLLLSIVAIAGAGTLAGLDIYQSGNTELGLEAFIAAALSFIAGWVSIALMMRWLEKSTFTPFAIYRVILGIILLSLIYSGSWA